MEQTHESVIVIVNSEAEMEERFLFFVNLIGLDRIHRTLSSRDYARIETKDYTIRFTLKRASIRGMRCQHLFDLTQDLEFHNQCTLPIIRSSKK